MTKYSDESLVLGDWREMGENGRGGGEGWCPCYLYEITRGKRHEITKEDRFIPWHVSFPRIASCAATFSRETLSYASFPFPFDYGQMSFLYSLYDS